MSLSLLFDRFPDSRHVRLIGLGGADDLAIWDRARLDGDLLVTKDDDFLRLSMSRGFPPEVICLAIGNASNIEAFSSHPEAGFLLLSAGSKP